MGYAVVTQGIGYLDRLWDDTHARYCKMYVALVSNTLEMEMYSDRMLPFSLRKTLDLALMHPQIGTQYSAYNPSWKQIETKEHSSLFPTD